MGSRKEHIKEYYYKNREKLLEKRRIWKQEHKEHCQAYAKEWRKRNVNSQRLYHQRWQTKVKTDVLGHYGSGKLGCVKCGFTDIRALSIDHINGDGATHRKVIKMSGQRFYRWLKVNDYPKGYQTLCMNCQFIKAAEEGESC